MGKENGFRCATCWAANVCTWSPCKFWKISEEGLLKIFARRLHLIPIQSVWSSFQGPCSIRPQDLLTQGSPWDLYRRYLQENLSKTLWAFTSSLRWDDLVADFQKDFTSVSAISLSEICSDLWKAFVRELNCFGSLLEIWIKSLCITWPHLWSLQNHKNKICAECLCWIPTRSECKISVQSLETGQFGERMTAFFWQWMHTGCMPMHNLLHPIDR